MEHAHTVPNGEQPGQKKIRTPHGDPDPQSDSEPNYFVSSASTALAFSAAGPSVTFWKAAMAWSFISLAL